MQLEQEKIAFDFEAFKNQAIADMRAVKSLVGKDGVSAAPMKEFLEATVESEIDSPMANCLGYFQRWSCLFGQFSSDF